MAQQLTIDANLLLRNEATRVSSFCHVAYSDELEAILAERYGRPGLCLKIHPPRWGSLDVALWGGVPLADAVIVQNLFAWHGLAPRVYDLAWVNGQNAAQVTEFVPPAEPEPDVARFMGLMDWYGVKARKGRVDLAPRNWHGGKIVDFSGLAIEDWPNYVRSLRERAYTRRGENIGSSYQPVKKLGIKGRRDISRRLVQMRFNELDLTGKTVLDIGSNLGAFCRATWKRGAQRVVGTDYRNIPELAFECNNALGFHNLDFVSAHLSEGRDNSAAIQAAAGPGPFDVVLCMAVQNYFGGYGSWIADLCGEVMYLEGHGGESSSVYWAALHRDFARVEFLGMTTDNYERPLFRCWK